MIPPIYHVGTGLWRPGCASWRDLVAGRHDPNCPEPRCEGIPPPLLRGLSANARVALDVALQAARMGGADLSRTHAVFASDLGEVRTAQALSEMLRAAEALSPLRFKNSVHNAASGHFSIAFSNRSPSTTLSAGENLIAAGLVEAWGLLAQREGEVLLVFSEESVPESLPGHSLRTLTGVAFHLRATPPAGPRVTLSNLRRGEPLGARLDPPRVRSRCADAAPWLEALTSPTHGTFALPDDGAPWLVDFNPER